MKKLEESEITAIQDTSIINIKKRKNPESVLNKKRLTLTAETRSCQARTSERNKAEVCNRDLATCAWIPRSSNDESS